MLKLEEKESENRVFVEGDIVTFKYGGIKNIAFVYKSVSNGSLEMVSLLHKNQVWVDHSQTNFRDMDMVLVPQGTMLEVSYE